MRQLWVWFHNHSLRFKMMILLFLLVMLLQIVNGLIFNSMVSEKFETNISKSNLATVNQMATNTNRMFKDIVTEMTYLREELLGTQDFGDNEEDSGEYASHNILYQGYFNQLVAEENNYQFINSMLILKENGRNYYYTSHKYMRLKNEDLYSRVIDDYILEQQCHWGTVIDESYFFTMGDKNCLVL